MIRQKNIQSHPAKNVFKKKIKKNSPKAKIEKFATKFYARYGEVMSKLSHE